MSFDNLITIGIIIYIIYSIKKTFSADKKKNGKETQGKTGWAGKLGDFINEVKEEIEKANRETMAEQEAEKAENTGFDWDDLKEPTHEKQSSDSKTISQTLFYEPNIPSEPPPVIEEIPEPDEDEESHRNYHGTHDTPMPLPVRKRKQCKHFNYKKSELKKAIIWSEILSKPVGLRD